MNGIKQRRRGIMIEMKIIGNNLYWNRHGLDFHKTFDTDEKLQAALEKYKLRRADEGVEVTIIK
jgi:hypothetical protein